MIAPPATVRHVSKDHVTITPSPAYRVIMFALKDGNIEAVVVAKDGSETIRLLVAGPSATQHMAIKRYEETGVVDILYAEKPDGR